VREVDTKAGRLEIVESLRGSAFIFLWTYIPDPAFIMWFLDIFIYFCDGFDSEEGPVGTAFH